LGGCGLRHRVGIEEVAVDLPVNVVAIGHAYRREVPAEWENLPRLGATTRSLLNASGQRTILYMPKPTRRLSRAKVIRALTRLGELCASTQSKVEIAIYGGTVMMLAYDCRAATKDVDAIFHPPTVVEPLVAQLARELHLPDDWLNSGVKAFVAKREEREAFAELQIPGLVITRPSAKYLLAMKCMAGRLPTPFREGDSADLKFLLRKLGIGSIEVVEAIVTDFYGPRAWLPEKRWLVEQLLKEVRDE
jgi:hypothetical protein